MLFTVRLGLLALGVSALLGSVSVQPVAAQEEDKVLKWVQEIILRPAIGGERTATRRFTRVPRLSIIGGTTEQKKAIADAVKQMNEVMEKTPLKKIVLGKDGDVSADFLILIQPHAAMPDLAKKLNIPGYDPDHTSLSAATVNKRNEIQNAYLLLAGDKIKADEIDQVAIWGVASGLGFMNTSSLIPDSIFGGGGTKLSDKDRKLIIFVYNYIPPGSDVGDVVRAYKAKWPKE
jgi:hypothetical protein